MTVPSAVMERREYSRHGLIPEGRKVEDWATFLARVVEGISDSERGNVRTLEQVIKDLGVK